jgi:hypothetical protein
MCETSELARRIAKSGIRPVHESAAPLRGAAWGRDMLPKKIGAFPGIS